MVVSGWWWHAMQAQPGACAARHAKISTTTTLRRRHTGNASDVKEGREVGGLRVGQHLAANGCVLDVVGEPVEKGVRHKLGEEEADAEGNDALGNGGSQGAPVSVRSHAAVRQRRRGSATGPAPTGILRASMKRMAWCSWWLT